jgi:hypothetical protein
MPSSPNDDRDRQKRDDRRHAREDQAELYGNITREMNALRPQYRGSSAEDIRAALAQRFGTELDEGRISACAHAIAANEAINLVLDPLPPRSAQQRSGPRPRRD